jgi:hypothetical protein
MKTYWMLLVFISAMFVSCDKKDEVSWSANVEGIWLGNWQTDDELLSGSFLAPVIQSDNKIEGQVFIRFTPPNDNSYGPDFFGSIREDKAHVQMNISNLDIQGEGKVENDSLVTGRFDVENYAQGDFEGSKYPLNQIKAEEIYVLENSPTWHTKLIALEEVLWLTDIERSEIKVIDKSGELISVFEDSIINMNPVTSGNNGIWVYSFDYESEQSGFSLYGLDGHLNDFVLLDIAGPEVIDFDSDTIYGTFFAGRKIYSFTRTGTLVDSINIDYIYPGTFLRYKNGFLIGGTRSSYLFYIDEEGNLLEAFYINDEIVNITMDSDKNIYCLTEEINFGEPATTYSYRVYRLGL